MKIAILTDIHANYRALEAVLDHVERWNPDRVFVAGDTVNRGPRSADCFYLIEEKRKTENWQVIRGNHEDYVIMASRSERFDNPRLREMYRIGFYTYEQLRGEIDTLRAMPEQLRFNFNGSGEVRMLHASMIHNRDGIYPETTDAELEKQIAPAPRVFITGHTHRPLVRNLNGTLVVNAGSVGLPFDGDNRAGYAQLTYANGKWQAKIIRLEYDLGAALRDFDEAGFIEGGGSLAELVRLELRTGLSQLYPWMERYRDAVLNGEISVEQAVSEFLERPVKQPYW